MQEKSEILKIDFECPPCKKNKTAGRIPIQRVIEKLDLCFKSNDLSEAERLLEFWKNEAFSLSDFKGELSVVNELLGLYRRTQRKEKAENAVLRAQELLVLTDNEDTVSGATIMLNAATTCKAFGNAKGAVPLYESAYNIYKKNLKADDALFSALYNNYATTLVDLKEHEKALHLYNKALEITTKNEKALLDSAITYINMAHLYEKTEGSISPEIEACLKKAEAVLYDERIEKNAYYAFVCEKCAPSFDYFGFFMCALDLQKKSREIYERA